MRARVKRRRDALVGFDCVFVLTSISVRRGCLALAYRRRMGCEDVAADVLLWIELEEVG